MIRYQYTSKIRFDDNIKTLLFVNDVDVTFLFVTIRFLCVQGMVILDTLIICVQT